MSNSAPEPDSRGRLPGASYKKRRWGRATKRKRKFYTKEDDAPASKKIRSSSSSRKLQGCTDKVDEASASRNRIININILFPALEKVVCCSVCHSKLKFSESDIRGLGFKIKIACENCELNVEVNSSNNVGKMNNSYEVNKRSVLAMRALGRGHAGLSTFCGLMDLPQPVSHSNFDIINKQLSIACETVAQDCMNTAVQEEISATPSSSTEPSSEVTVSGDGSWRTVGFCSLQGISSVIGNHTGKVLDVSIKNSFCKACAKWEGKEDTVEYQEWYEEHQPQCSSNHEGNAGKMEVDGILEIFHRSEQKYGVRYTKYIGDGDSKVFKSVLEAKPYGDDFVVEKKECVGHVQKRMGNRLRNLKKSLGRKPLSDGKSIGGKGRLTAQVIGQLSRYYGNAIRAHKDSIDDMSRAIWSTFYHKISTDDKPQHQFCPQGTSSWCQWQKAKANNQLRNFKHKSSLPSAVMDQLKPIYSDLTDQELLKRCLGGYTQNNNESFNNSVWQLVPKSSFSGLTVLKIGVNIAVTIFNDGRTSFLKILKEFGINPGVSCTRWVQSSDDQRLFHAERKTLANTMEARRSRREKRLTFEESSYAPGAF